MPAQNMSAPPRMVFTCKPVTAPAPARPSDPSQTQALRVVAQVSVPGLLFAQLGDHSPCEWKNFRGIELTVATNRSRQLRDVLTADRMWQRWLMVIAESLAEGKDCQLALDRSLDLLLELPDVERRFLRAAASLPTDRLPHFAVVRAIPAEIVYAEPAVLDPALALALLVRTGGSVFSISRAPSLPTAQCLDVCYEYSAYCTPLDQVGR